MLKMKMMTFFKNPIVKDIFIVLTTIIIVASIISIPVSNAGSQINVGFRAASMGINAGSKDIQIPEIAPDQSADKKAKYKNMFCIQEGNNLSYGVYTSEYNGYNSGESSKYFKNYGSAVWLVDNMYIADSANSSIGLDYLAELVTSPDVAKVVTQYGNITTDNIKSLNKTVGGKKDSKGNAMDKNFIEVIEQLVLWNYTNNPSGINPDTLVNGGFSGINITDNDQKAAKYLYYALKHLAGNNSNYTSNGTVANSVSFDTSKATINTEKAQVGPYALKSNGVNLNIDNTLKSKLSAVVTKADGSTVNVDSSKIVVDSDGSFYVDIKECGQVTNVKVNVADIYTGCTVTFEVIVNGKNQNIINVRKTYNTKPFSDEKSITYSGKYTVKLIKTKIDGSTVITDNPAVFTVSGAVDKKGAETGKDGILVIADGKQITNASATEKYTIVEDTAPKGYTKYDGTINLDVVFKTTGTTYALDKEKIKMTANGKIGTVKLNVPNDNTIEIYVPNKEEEKKSPKFDLALRKFITKIDGKDVEVSRVPVIDQESKEVLDLIGTAVYHHTKKALDVKIGSQVEYTIRVYNEGEVDGVAKEITDYLPSGLTFVKIADESAKLYTTDTKEGSKEVVLKYAGSDVLPAGSVRNNKYQEVKLICKVNEGAAGYITNRAEITVYGYTDKEGTWHEAKAIGDSDRDSVEKTISKSLGLDTWYENAKTYTYDLDGKAKEVTDYYPGVQDDDDFETVVVESIKGQFKVIIKKVDLANKNQGLAGAYFTLKTGEKVGPTDENGYIELVKEQKITEENQKFSYTFEETTAPEGYDRYDKEITLNVATKTEDGEYVVDEKNTKLADSSDRVSLDVKSNVITIEIKDEKTKKNFDLALRKFITNVNGKEITSRIPKVTLTDDFKSGKVTTANYEHTKDPVDVVQDNIVTYTIRIYNEGEVDGYATKVMDDIPDGLEYLPENEINKANGWKMYVESDKAAEGSITYNKKIYVPTTDVKNADLIVTDALKDQLIKAYDAKTMSTLDYKDVKVAFKVVEPNTSDRIIINYAQITEHKDTEGNTTVIDRDSTPNEWIEGEDDQDIEKIRLRYFDLALRKWVTEAIVTENGETQVTPTGHHAEDDPEAIVKVDIKKSKINNVTVKFRYSIRVTNEGEIAGYAKEVTDYIPAGLKFVSEDNQGWTTTSDPNVVKTELLADTLLQPGESAEVTIVLTWINDANNMGVKINTAEISKDYNEYGAKDIDSTPNNKVPGEDDIDDAPVMLSVKTGSAVIGYVTLAVAFLAIVGIGSYTIKRRII